MAEAVESQNIAATAVALLEQIRSRRPRIHVLTSPVAMPLSANVLLAVGAVPSMTFDPHTVSEFVAGAQALVVNLGMLDAERKAAIPVAIAAAAERGLPWLLDPVKVERSGTRRQFALSLLAAKPAILRANAAEIAVLAGASTDARALAACHRCVVVTTGAVDCVTDGKRQQRIANGCPLMERVTAMGCALSAFLGAFLAVAADPFVAACAGVLAFGVAGESAGERASGPGSLPVALLDTLYALDAATVQRRARLS